MALPVDEYGDEDDEDDGNDGYCYGEDQQQGPTLIRLWINAKNNRQHTAGAGVLHVHAWMPRNHIFFNYIKLTFCKPLEVFETDLSLFLSPWYPAEPELQPLFRPKWPRQQFSLHCQLVTWADNPLVSMKVYVLCSATWARLVSFI